MIEAGRAIELRDNRRQIDAEAPFVRTPSDGFEGAAPAIPPGHDGPGDRLDDQHAIAAAMPAFEKPCQEPVALARRVIRSSRRPR